MGVSQWQRAPVIRRMHSSAPNCSGIVKSGHYFSSLLTEAWLAGCSHFKLSQ